MTSQGVGNDHFITALKIITHADCSSYIMCLQRVILNAISSAIEHSLRQPLRRLHLVPIHSSNFSIDHHHISSYWDTVVNGRPFKATVQVKLSCQ